ncbi:sulfotransferase family 2 domain-containing protein [Trichothermofontia sp.]
MLVSHRHKFIYTKTIKTGGTSVESYFERFCMPSEWSLSHERDESISEVGIVGFRGRRPPPGCLYWNHMPAALIKQRIGPSAWDQYFKFCVIRNPYDKVVSAFYFFQYMEKGFVDFGDLDYERTKLENWLRSCIQWPNRFSGLPIDRDKYMIGNQFCLDGIIRYENIAADMAKVCQHLDLPWEPSLLPKFKAGIRPPEAKAADLYTPIARKIVEAIFAFELKFFAYTFPT